MRTVADLKVTGRNKEGEEPVAIGEAIRAVFVPVGDTVSSRGLAKGKRPVLLRRVAIVAGAWRLLKCSLRSEL